MRWPAKATPTARAAGATGAAQRQGPVVEAAAVAQPVALVVEGEHRHDEDRGVERPGLRRRDRNPEGAVHQRLSRRPAPERERPAAAEDHGKAGRTTPRTGVTQNRQWIELRAHRKVGGERAARGEVDVLPEVGKGRERRAFVRVTVEIFAMGRRLRPERPLLLRERHRAPDGVPALPSPIRSRYQSTSCRLAHSIGA